MLSFVRLNIKVNWSAIIQFKGSNIILILYYIISFILDFFFYYFKERVNKNNINEKFHYDYHNFAYYLHKMEGGYLIIPLYIDT